MTRQGNARFTASSDKATMDADSLRARKQAELQMAALVENNRRLHESEQRHQDIFDSIPDGIFLFEVTGCKRFRLLDINRAMEAFWGGSRLELAGRYIEDALSDAMRAALVPHLLRSVESGTAVEHEFTLHLPTQGRYDFAAKVIPVHDRSGCIFRLSGVWRDITALKASEALLHKREQEFRRLVENSPDTISCFDRDCRRIYANPRLLTLMGGDLGRIIGTTPSQAGLPGGKIGREYERVIRQMFEDHAEREFEVRWQPAVGSEMCSHVRLSPEFDLDGNVVHVVAVGRDITDIDRYRRQIHEQAYFDSLTGLPNRRLLSERLRQCAQACENESMGFRLLLLDLDNFKEVNDTFGHGTGDLLLREAGARLRSAVRALDTVARLGGDEFALVIPDTEDDGEGCTVASRILHALSAPFMIDGRDFMVTASIGIARYPSDSRDVDDLFRYADLAMYHAKKLGRNNYQFYELELSRKAAERLEMEAALRRACRGGELELYYQPQVDMSTGHLVGAEALLRWNRAGHGMVSPDQFIPVAEASGLIVDIGAWVAETACRAAVEWNRSRRVPLRVAINLSTRQFMRNDLAGMILTTLEDTGCRPEWLKLEITESLLLEDSAEVIAMLEMLSEAGISIAIDDFGTGYSSLNYLNNFPVSEIKIDRSFVSDIPARKDKAGLVRAMLSISSALEIETVAEGVETQAQADYLMAHGCRLAQGYLYGAAMTHGAFARLVEAPAEQVREVGTASA